MNIEPYQLRGMILDSNKIAVRATLIDLGLYKPYLSYAQAHKEYGRKKVEKWLSEGRLKRGEKISRMELDAANFSEKWEEKTK